MSAAMKLVLEDGTILPGKSFASARTVAGEVVFNTAMTGYVESLTDPSYRGQILVLTYPLQGNYGVPPPRKPGSIDRPYEASKIQVQGLVVQNYVPTHSHHAGTRSLGEWLASEDVPGITGIDTRTLTRKLREKGTMRGWLFPAEQSLEDAQRMAHTVEMKTEVWRLVAPTQPIKYPGGEPHVLLVDAGAKDNLVRSLLERGATVTRAPWHADIVKLAQECDGILLGNGPGDPEDLQPLVEKIRTLLPTYNKPIFGVCLGNQILAWRPAATPQAALRPPRREPAGARPAHPALLHHLAEPRLRAAGQQPARRLGALVRQPERRHQRGRPRPLQAFFSVQFHPEASPGPATPASSSTTSSAWWARADGSEDGHPCTVHTSPRSPSGPGARLGRPTDRPGR
jgi:carbamoyl-phosphate synthase small subunit